MQEGNNKINIEEISFFQNVPIVADCTEEEFWVVYNHELTKHKKYCYFCEKKGLLSMDESKENEAAEAAWAAHIGKI